MSEMASRISRTRSLLPTLESSLNAFKSTSSPFKIIRSINPPSTSTPNPPITSTSPALGAGPRTLFILDSSYNPPSRAHLALATTALSTTTEPAPRSLLLLFSTSNADKAPTPATFVQRLAMMIIFAEDLQWQLQQSHSSTQPKTSEASSTTPDTQKMDEISIDIALTTAPYYTDKSLAITNAEPPPYPSSPAQIHLLGYDTLTRFLAPKYYTTYTPPLSALSPYFDAGHKLLVLLRPENSSAGNSSSGDSEEQQRHYITTLAHDNLKKEGFKKEWAKQIAILSGSDISKATGISSTLIRKAVKNGEWDKVGDMCTEGVAAWIREEGLYGE